MLRRAIEASLRDAGPVAPQMGAKGLCSVAHGDGPASPSGLSNVASAPASVQPVQHTNGGLEVLQRDSMSSNGDAPLADDWGVENMGKLNL